MKTLLAELVACMALAACAVQPAAHDNLPDTVKQLAPAAWRVAAPQGGPGAADPQAWWQQFNDPVMHQLVRSVLDHNLDVQAALERITQAEAVRKQAHATLLPALSLGTAASVDRQNLPPPVGEVRQAGAGLDLDWQPDVFGGERLKVLAAQARLSGSQEALQALRLALAANTASAYIDLRWAQAELDILQDNAKIRSDALRLTQRRREFGLATSLDVARARNQLDELQARVPGARATIEHQLSLIAIYSGRTPESTEQLLTRIAAVPVPPAALPELLPSQALLRRPDVSQAYATVELRAAQVGASQAQRYPQFSLHLSDGLLAASYLGLPTLTDNVFDLALSATSPIFNAGRIDAQIAGSQSKLREAELGLHQTMLVALKDVEDSRSDFVSAGLQLERRGAALETSAQALRLSKELYKGGASSFLDVLSAQESYLSDANGLNQARRARALAAVALYRALGGGWQGTPDGGATDLARAETPAALPGTN